MLPDMNRLGLCTKMKRIAAGLTHKEMSARAPGYCYGCLTTGMRRGEILGLNGTTSGEKDASIICSFTSMNPFINRIIA